MTRATSDNTAKSKPFPRGRPFPGQIVLLGALVVIIGVGAFLRLYRLGVSPIWGDQSILYSIALDFVNNGKLPLAANKASAGAMNPPFVEYLIALPLFVSKSVLSPLWFQALLSTLAIAILYRTSVASFDRLTASLAALLFALNPWAVHFSRLLWNPSYTPLFSALLLATVLGYLKTHRPIHLVLSFIWLAILTQLHLSALVLVPTLGVVGLVFSKRLWSRLGRKIVAPTVIGILGFGLIYLPYMVFERAGGYGDVKALLGVLTGTSMSGLANVEGVTFNGASLLLMLELATGDHFLINQVDAWREAVPRVSALFWLMRAMVVASLVYALLAPMLWWWRHRDTGKMLPHRQVALLVSGLWVVVPVLLYLRHTHYLQNYFFLYLLPPTSLLLAAFARLIVRQATRIRPKILGRLTQTAAVLPVVLVSTWNLVMLSVGLNLAGGTDIVGQHTAGDLERAAIRLRELSEDHPECAVTVLAEGHSLDTSPVGFFEPLLYPLDVRLAAQGQGFIVPSACAIYFLSASDPIAESILTRYGIPLGQMETNRGTWRFHYMAGLPKELLPATQLGRWTNGLELREAQVVGTFAPSQKIQLVHTWRIAEQPRGSQDFHFFNHLLNSAGELVAQVDSAAIHPVYWRHGDALVTQFELELPSILPPGEYSLQLGVYTWPDIVRVPLEDGRTSITVANVAIP